MEWASDLSFYKKAVDSDIASVGMSAPCKFTLQCPELIAE